MNTKEIKFEISSAAMTLTIFVLGGIWMNVLKTTPFVIYAKHANRRFYGSEIGDEDT